MAELADALDLGSSGIPCRFDSCHPHFAFYKRIIDTGVWLSLARALDLGSRGRRFESCHPDYKAVAAVFVTVFFTPH